MKDGLLEKIRGYGHWRVNIRPQSPLPERLDLRRCQEVVEQSCVSIRGWDYPHISRRNDEQSGAERAGDYFENWCDWRSQIEFWRMYRSGQFISYNALNDDAEGYGQPGVGALNIVDAIYTISEFTDFAGRLMANVPFVEGVRVAIGLNETAGRQLSAGRNRIPFFEPKTTQASSIKVERQISPGDDTQELAIDIMAELFDHFGWNPDKSQLRGDQTKFYRREFSG